MLWCLTCVSINYYYISLYLLIVNWKLTTSINLHASCFKVLSCDNSFCLLSLLCNFQFSRGKMGASLHRTMRKEAVGGEPPYLMVSLDSQSSHFYKVSDSFVLICILTGSQPFFGMFGYGGPVATMCLGRYKIQQLLIYNHKVSVSIFLLFLFFPSYLFLKNSTAGVLLFLRRQREARRFLHYTWKEKH